MILALIRRILAAALAGLLLAAAPAGAATLDCPSATTLEALVDCISLQMPQAGSNGYVAPTPTQQLEFRTAVAQMMQGQCGFALGSNIAANMAIRTFTDSGNGRTYCVLMETLDANNNGFVDKGWGTFITYANATREMSHHAPHPKFSTASAGSEGDSYSEREAVRIFMDTGSRSYLMCGARRSANSGSSTCQSSYAPADCAHNVDSMFHAANVELNNFYGAQDWLAIQWHGKAVDTCSMDMFMSIGLNQNPPAGSKVLTLKAAIDALRPDWSTATPSNGGCSLNATDNTQGRLLNGVAAGSVCGTAAGSASQKFMHIEQTSGIIADIDGSSASWASAIIAAFPTSAPGAPGGVAAAPGNQQVTVSWNAVTEATTYNLKRGTTAGGPYPTVISGITGTSRVDAGLTNGTTYYYVVSAQNTAGESPNSAQVSATPAGPAAPPPPTGLTANPGTKKKIVLAWTASAGATSYTVRRATVSGGPYSNVATGVTATSYTNSGLSSGTTYYYVVAAVGPGGTSGDSNQASAVAP